MEFYSSATQSSHSAGFSAKGNVIPELDVNVLMDGEAFVPVIVTDRAGNRVPLTDSAVIRGAELVAKRDASGAFVLDADGNKIMETPKSEFALVYVYTKNAAGQWERKEEVDPTDNVRKPVLKHLYPTSINHRLFTCEVARLPKFAGNVDPVSESNLNEFDLDNITARSGIVTDTGSVTALFQAIANNGGANAAFVALYDKLIDENGNVNAVATYKKDKTHPYFISRLNPRPGQTKAAVDYQRIWDIESI